MKSSKQTNKLKYALITILVLPSVVLAASTLNDIESAALNILNLVVPLFIAAAVVVFLWSVLKYINSGDNAETREQAKSLMIYGVIAIFVMVSVWGLVGVLRNMFTLNGNVLPVDPNSIILEM